jgi:hypothetical protein
MVDVASEVGAAIDAYLGTVDAAAPGLVDSLAVTGSVALGDYCPSTSDVDLVAVVRARPTDADLVALASVHRPSRPSVDVLYVTRDDLARNPCGLSLPGSVGAEFRRDGAFDANPVVWRLLARHAITMRGVLPPPEDVWFDADVLRRWNLANLDSYWSEWVRRARAEDPTELRVRHEYGLQWMVLGVPRLHYTVATLDVTSKSGAGRYAREVAPTQWRVVLDAALALRDDMKAPLPAPIDQLWRDAIDLSAWFIDDAHRVMAQERA